MRTITDHIVDGDSPERQLNITVMDEPGQGGANHEYVVTGPEGRCIPPIAQCEIAFQNGPIADHGVNGVTQEVLLAIVIDRLRSFQAGPFSCRDNAIALTHCEDALMRLQRRTRDRIKRGVEGTTQK
jgi:hypothetical protein